jgi:membrane fusion protein (multidrug efflux system)
MISKQLWILGFLLPLGCGSEPEAARPDAASEPAITNRVAIPQDVAQNLGLTFAKATLGRLEIRIGVPGFLEIPAHRRFQLRAPAGGFLRLRKNRWDPLLVGELIAELHSSELSDLQTALAQSQREILVAQGEVARVLSEGEPLAALVQSLEQATRSASRSEKLAARLLSEARAFEQQVQQRVARLDELSTGSGVSASERVAARKDVLDASQAVLNAEQSQSQAALSIPELQLRAARSRADLENLDRRRRIAEQSRAAADAAHAQILRNLAHLTGEAVEDLTAAGPEGPAYASHEWLSLRAPAAGWLSQLLASDGAWVEAGELLLEVVDNSELWFLGDVPEGDLAHLKMGARVRIEVASGGDPIESILQAPLPVADSATRTVHLRATVANANRRLPAGMSAIAQVVVERGTHEEVLVPERCVIQDGLEWICFRRDPGDAEQVIRTPVSLGRRSAGFVEVFSGVGAGDELVADGIHQLKEAATAQPNSGGHFHADGSFHAEDH